MTASCACCDTQLRFPAQVQAFRCTVCDSVNDLVPLKHPVHPVHLSLEKVRLYQNAVGNKTCEPEVFKSLLAACFGSAYNMNKSFPKGSGTPTLQNPGVDMAEAREAYRILLRMPPEYMDAVVEGMEKSLRRPGRRLTEALDLRFLLILLDQPVWLGRTTVADQAQRHHQLFGRLLGLISTLSNDLHRHVVSWFTSDPEDAFHRRVETVNYFLTFRLTRIEGMRERYPTDWSIKAAARVMALLCGFRCEKGTTMASLADLFLYLFLQVAANGMRTRGRLPTAVFYNSVVDYLDFQKDFQRWQEERGLFSFCQYPFLISLGSKMVCVAVRNVGLRSTPKTYHVPRLSSSYSSLTPSGPWVRH
jgi:E3 ubiquitin-protein ligase HECTD2